MKTARWGLLILILFTTGCAAGTDQITPPPSPTPGSVEATEPIGDMEGAQIRYEVSGGIAGINESWAAFGDGRFITADGSTHSIKLEQFAILLQAIDRLGFFEMKYRYDPLNTCADCFTYKLTISYGGQSNEISWRDGDTDLPIVMSEVQELILNFFIVDPPLDD